MLLLALQAEGATAIKCAIGTAVYDVAIPGTAVKQSVFVTCLTPRRVMSVAFLLVCKGFEVGCSSMCADIIIISSYRVHIHKPLCILQQNLKVHSLFV